MAYRFKHSQTVPQNVRRIALEEMGSAIRHLRGKRGESRDDAIHEVRKSIKKTRALLRLVRQELGDFFAAENGQLRDAGQQLSDLRDAGAIIGVLDKLRKRSGVAPDGRSFSHIRQALIRQKQQLDEEVTTRKLTAGLADALAQGRKFVKQWPLQSDGFHAIEGGIRRSFRDGRKALAQARKHGRREDFHEWRKRVKDLWYQVRLTRIGGGVLQGYEHSLGELEDALGEDLNLAILEDRVRSIASENGFGSKPASLTRAIRSARKDLRARYLDLGNRVYAEKPREFAAQIKRLWKARK